MLISRDYKEFKYLCTEHFLEEYDICNRSNCKKDSEVYGRNKR